MNPYDFTGEDRSIEPIKMWQGDHHWDYSKWCDLLMAEHARTYYSKLFKSDATITLSPKGFFPGHDAVIGDLKIEMKVQSGVKLKIEVARVDGSPSGLAKTDADFWMTLSPGRNNKAGRMVGKSRCIDVAVLKELWEFAKRSGLIKKYNKNEWGPGCKYFVLDTMTLGREDGWIDADVECDMTSSNLASKFYMDKIIQYRK